MATIKIAFLVHRTNKSGVTTWYWQPSAALAKAGWKSIPLGECEATAMELARKQNAAIDDWKKGGSLATPETVATAAPAGRKASAGKMTVAALIAHYKEAGCPKLVQSATRDDDGLVRASTRKSYRQPLKRIEEWAGPETLDMIDPERVSNFRKALVPAIGHANAFYTLTVLRLLFAYARKEGLDPRLGNPAADFGLAKNPPRRQLWDHDHSGGDFAAFAKAAIATGSPELPFAIELLLELGQRPGDMLRLSEDKWRELTGFTSEQREALVHYDGPNAGKVMGFRFRQQKTDAWVGIPVVGELRRKIEAAITHNRARDVPVTTILVNDKLGQPWKHRTFDARFQAARAYAAETLGLPHMADLQIRDLRRTAVVRMGELNLEPQAIAAITGHTLASVMRILEVYMPRTTRMAATAVIARAAHRAAAG